MSNLSDDKSQKVQIAIGIYVAACAWSKGLSSIISASGFINLALSNKSAFEDLHNCTTSIALLRAQIHFVLRLLRIFEVGNLTGLPELTEVFFDIAGMCLASQAYVTRCLLFTIGTGDSVTWHAVAFEQGGQTMIECFDFDESPLEDIFILPHPFEMLP
jgi:hypothetical protein